MKSPIYLNALRAFETFERLAARGRLRLDRVAIDSADRQLAAAAKEWLLSAGRKQQVRIVLEE